VARRVFLHVGLPKTGTTYLQTRMWRQRDRLADLGFLYPGRVRMDHFRAWQDLHRGLGGPRDSGTWERLCAAVAAHPGDALITHEFFSMATPEEAATAVAALEPAEVHLVLTLRAYHLQFPAVWQEALKMGSRRTFSEFMEQVVAEDRTHTTLKGAWSWRSQDIPTVLAHWTSAVPSERVTVVTVPPPGSPRAWLWERWCEALGLDAAVLDRRAPFANESLGAAQAALMLRVTPRLRRPLKAKGNERHRWLRQYFGHEVLGPQKGARFVPREVELDRLRSLADEAIAAIEGSGAQVVGDLADLRPPASVSGAHPDDVTEAEVLDAAAVAIEQMIRDVRKLTRQNERLRRRLRRTNRGRLRRIRNRVRRRLRRRFRGRPRGGRR
jgi:hypothetical protein